MPVDINAAKCGSQIAVSSQLLEGVGESQILRHILLQEVPENASNVVLKLQNASYSGRGPEPPPRPTPAWSLRSLAAKASFFRFIVLHIFHPHCHFVLPPPP